MLHSCKRLIDSDADTQPLIQKITPPVEHAEVPTWDYRKQMLFYTDVHEGRIYSYHYPTKTVHSIYIGGNLNPVIPVKNNDNLLVVGQNRSLVVVEWDGTYSHEDTKQHINTKVISTVSADYPNSGFNDGKSDATGRLWVGTMGQQNVATGEVRPYQGHLYSFTKFTLNNPEVHIPRVHISNGLAWNKKNDTFFYVDSGITQIVSYDFEPSTGSISNRKVVFDLAKHPELIGICDGMTIDENDNLWVALYGGGSIIQVSPQTGKVLQRVALPARDVTSVTWGGPKLDILFVTTSRILLSEQERREQPDAGSVFAVTKLKTKGKAEYFTDIIVDDI
ncbi:unnamed protein product [Ceutorhynchus assimilis]|uniref:Regucalcin n=1 Tax=Ceutorhynchus assimilis TaxID=467358 RepID=A0A9N9QPP4_9CUCU|nr:unnamed protein product [Ceutorhynchus assimilis]